MTPDKPIPATVHVFNFPDEQEAIRIAEKLAVALRKTVVVKNETGNKIWVAEPALPGFEPLN
jgi:hypothetical protein